MLRSFILLAGALSIGFCANAKTSIDFSKKTDDKIKYKLDSIDKGILVKLKAMEPVSKKLGAYNANLETINLHRNVAGTNYFDNPDNYKKSEAFLRSLFVKYRTYKIDTIRIAIEAGTRDISSLDRKSREWHRLHGGYRNENTILFKIGQEWVSIDDLFKKWLSENGIHIK